MVDFKDDLPTLFCPFFFPSWGQCHQHFTRGFSIQKFRFLYLHFKLVLFWNKNIGAKAALKMLVKLTPRVNFISKFIHSFYSYNFLCSSTSISPSISRHKFHQLLCQFCDILHFCFIRSSPYTRCQFHQHFTRDFFIRKFRLELFCI